MAEDTYDGKLIMLEDYRVELNIGIYSPIMP